MAIQGRQFSSNSYRYGYNKGSEKDDEISGAGNHFTTEFREGDTRLMTWWGIDPKASEQPWQSPYSYMDGNPIQFNDPLGDCVPCLEAAAIASEVVIIYRASKGTRTLISIIQGLQAAHSTFGEITLNGRDITDPFVLYTKDNNPTLYSAYLLNRYHSDKYATVKEAYVAIVAAEIRKVHADEMSKKGPKDLVGEAKAQKEKEETANARSEKRESQTKVGKTKEGKSNQDVKGSHASGGNKPGKHDRAVARRAKEQGVKGPDLTK